MACSMFNIILGLEDMFAKMSIFAEVGAFSFLGFPLGDI